MTRKLARPDWRFELFYFDYSFGVLLIAIICAFTFGSLGYDGFSFMDDMLNAGKRSVVMGFGAGVIFNLANMLLVAAISVAGLAVAIPVSWALGRFIENQLFGVRPMDAISIAGAGAVLAIVCLAASAVPALRAESVSPLDTLRSE